MPSGRSRPLLKLDSINSALPSDVRRGSASPLSLNFQFGLSPWFGLCPNDQRSEAEPGAEPKPQWGLNGEAEPRLTSGGKAATQRALELRSASSDQCVAGKQLALDYRNLSVNHSIQVQLTTACKSEVLRRVRE